LSLFLRPLAEAGSCYDIVYEKNVEPSFPCVKVHPNGNFSCQSRRLLVH
jgi:hypothetical protein